MWVNIYFFMIWNSIAVLTMNTGIKNLWGSSGNWYRLVLGWENVAPAISLIVPYKESRGQYMIS
jgi:hypothetical protein